jgi:hypothetical protein
VLPHAVERFRKPAPGGVACAGVEPQEVVRQEDRLRVADLVPAHHHFKIHSGPVLADLAGGAEHLHIQQRVPLLKADQRGRYKLGTETVRRADPHHP